MKGDHMFVEGLAFNPTFAVALRCCSWGFWFWNSHGGMEGPGLVLGFPRVKSNWVAVRQCAEHLRLGHRHCYPLGDWRCGHHTINVSTLSSASVLVTDWCGNSL